MLRIVVPMALIFFPAALIRPGDYKFVQYTGGSMDQVVAVGDTSNDVEMVSAVGLGLAMRNATPDLQSAAAAVTVADNNHAGLLRAIEALFSL
jgi:Predicted hydrolases of the HAD superfamily